MPAATTKSELITVTTKEFAKVSKLVATLTAEQAMLPDEEDTSIKDVIAHRAHWAGLFLGWYEDGLAGKSVYFPSKGYKWNDLKRYNADLRGAQQDMDWPMALAQLTQAHDALLAFIETHSDTALYGGPMKGANNKWTPGRWAEAAGPSHYRSAAKYIRTRLKAMNA
jgi:hypothetical protein